MRSLRLLRPFSQILVLNNKNCLKVHPDFKFEKPHSTACMWNPVFMISRVKMCRHLAAVWNNLLSVRFCRWKWAVSCSELCCSLHKMSHTEHLHERVHVTHFPLQKRKRAARRHAVPQTQQHHRWVYSYLGRTSSHFPSDTFSGEPALLFLQAVIDQSNMSRRAGNINKYLWSKEIKIQYSVFGVQSTPVWRKNIPGSQTNCNFLISEYVPTGGANFSPKTSNDIYGVI